MPLLTPQQVELLSGVSPDLIRNWRSREFIDKDFGKKVGNKHCYLATQALNLYLMRHLVDDLGVPHRVAWMASGVIILELLRNVEGFKFLRGKKEPSPDDEVPNPLMILFESDGEWGYFTDITVHGKTDIGNPGGYILHLWRIAQSIPGPLAEIVIVEELEFEKELA